VAGRGEPRRLLELLCPAPLAADSVDRPVPRGRREPGSGPLRQTFAGPANERDLERFLDGVLGERDVAGQARDRGDRAPPLLANDRGDDVGVYRSTTGLTSIDPC